MNCAPVFRRKQHGTAAFSGNDDWLMRLYCLINEPVQIARASLAVSVFISRSFKEERSINGTPSRTFVKWLCERYKKAQRRINRLHAFAESGLNVGLDEAAIAEKYFPPI